MGLGGGVGFGGRVGSHVLRVGLGLCLQAAHQHIQVVLLAFANGFAAELGAKHIGLGREAPNAAQQLAHGFARQRLVDSGGGHFAFHAHQAGLAFLGQGQLVAAQNGDHVARLQHQVLAGVALQDCAAQVKGQQLGSQALGVEALHHRVVPVDLVGHAPKALGDFGARLFGSACGFGAQGGLVALGEQVFALEVVGSDQRLGVRYQIQNAHARKPAVAHRLGHNALQGDGVGKRRAHGQQGEDVTSLKLLRQAVGVERQVQHLAGRFNRRVDALQQGLSHGGNGRQATAIG